MSNSRAASVNRLRLQELSGAAATAVSHVAWPRREAWGPFGQRRAQQSDDAGCMRTLQSFGLGVAAGPQAARLLPIVSDGEIANCIAFAARFWMAVFWLAWTRRRAQALRTVEVVILMAQTGPRRLGFVTRPLDRVTTGQRYRLKVEHIVPRSGTVSPRAANPGNRECFWSTRKPCQFDRTVWWS